MASQITIKPHLYDDRGKWTVRARFPDVPGGKPRLHAKATGYTVSGNNKRKAEAAMREITAQWERQLKEQAPIDPNATFGDCVRSWLRTRAGKIRPNTLAAYKMYADKHIIPALGGIKLKDLKRQHIQEYYNSLEGTTSPNTMRKHNVIIHGALKYAVLDGVLTSDVGNVLTMVELPAKKKYEGKSLTTDEVRAVFQKINDEREPLRSALVLGLCYGLRRSEICGLRWQDVDFENSAIYIRNTVTDYSGTLYEAERTKTLASRRSIQMIQSTTPYLKSLYERREAQGMVSDKVCAYEDGRAVAPAYLTRNIKKFLAGCGAENVRLHDLRHTAATVLIRGGMPVVNVSAFLGHNQVSTTTDVYAHVLDNERGKASEAMNSYMESLGFCSGNCSGTDQSNGDSQASRA